MPGLFSRLKGRDGKLKSKKGALDELAEQQQQKPRWEDAWARKTVEPEEVQQLIRCCTEELKARALDLPFVLLPFRPTSDPSAVRTFVRNFFGRDGGSVLSGEELAQELRIAEPMVISGVIKWCWSRLPGGVVGWDSYELFRIGEQDSHMARDSFKTFIPLSVDNESRSKIIFDFFDLLSAIAAHSKNNGFGGRKLSRMAGWWAFEHTDNGNGFEGGYKTWLRQAVYNPSGSPGRFLSVANPAGSAADATSHLFFAYLRSLAPEPVRGGISMLPMSLQKLLQETEYPPQKPSLLQTSTNRVSMIVDTVSPTPFALLRRANHFQYRDEDKALKEWSEYEDPIQALTEECRRVLKAISAANQSQAVSSSKHSTGLRDASWSRFEDIGFASTYEEEDTDDDPTSTALRQVQGLRTTPASGRGDLGRPTTPSWADFLSSGFAGDRDTPSILLPPDKVLPPIDTGTSRQRSSQSHRPRLESQHQLEPGELASIVRFDLDDAFWWVWMSSLAPEETPERKAVFGRCAVIETIIRAGRWLVMEEIVKGAAPEPEEGAYIAEKKGFFSWTRRGKGLGRRKSTGKHNTAEKADGHLKASNAVGSSKASIGPDQQAKIQAAALLLQKQEQQRTQQQQQQQAQEVQERRGRRENDLLSDRTNSVLTLQPSILTEASPAVKWASKYDKEAIKEAYLADANAGRGVSTTSLTNGHASQTSDNDEARPELPPKEATSPQRNGTPTPGAQPSEEKKGLEPPQEVHPAERTQSPVPPPKEPGSLEIAREQMVSPEPGASPDGQKHRKLHKESSKSAAAGGSGGNALKKLFSRRNRNSKLPENAAEQLKSITAATEEPSSPARTSTSAAPTGPATPTAPVAAEAAAEPAGTATPTSPAAPQKAAEREEALAAPPKEHPAVPAGDQPAREPAAAPQPVPEPAPAPESSVPQEVSPVNTENDEINKAEFSRFNQGPLLDQPAFVPEDSSDEDEAVPPPIPRHSPRIPPPEQQQQQQQQPQPQPQPQPQQKQYRSIVEEKKAALAQASASRTTDPQDRWAQLRKNAAERAAYRQATQGARASTSFTDDSSEESK
ncbi:hypothetical protein VTH82DRAFT_3116 [Thermothelomyces myriococcoides]